LNLNNRREIIAAIALALAAGIVVFAVASSSRAPAAQTVGATLDPTTAALLTAAPQATSVSGAFAERVRAIESAVEDCGDYPERRKVLMQQYVNWLFEPSTIPPEMMMLFSPNPTGRIVFAMAADTSTEWRRLQRPPDSCLVPIGRELNALLTSVGEQPIAIYDE
jgi:hypothetical protein